MSIDRIKEFKNICFSSSLRWNSGAHKNEKAHWLGRTTEWLFDFGGKGYQVTPKTEQDREVPTRFDAGKKPGFWITLLKVVLCATAIIPLIFVIGKAIYRRKNKIIERDVVAPKEMESYQQNIAAPKPDVTTPLTTVYELINHAQELQGKIQSAQYYSLRAEKKADRETIKTYNEVLLKEFEVLKTDPLVNQIDQYVEEIVNSSSATFLDLKILSDTVIRLGLKPLKLQKKMTEIAPIGLGNIGNSCYINSFLQAMMAVPELKNYLETTKDNDKIIAALKEFKTAYEAKNPEKCKGAIVNLRKEAFAKGSLYKGNLSQQNDPYLLFSEVFGKAKQTVNIFGFVQNKVLEPVGILALAVPPVGGVTQEGPYCFQELLNDNFAEDKIALTEGQLKLPETVLCQFGRFAWDIKKGGMERLNGPVTFPREGIVDLKECIKWEGVPQQPVLYQLVAVVNHMGDSVDSGHYTAEVKRAGQWYYCNDGRVVPRENNILPSYENGYYFALRRIP